jgi:hypothetical protein
MYAADMSSIVIGMILLLAYNAVMTILFINQRYNFRNNKWLRNFALFLVSIVAQIILAPVGMGIWILMYFVTISALYIVDKLVKRKLKKESSRTSPSFPNS